MYRYAGFRTSIETDKNGIYKFEVYVPTDILEDRIGVIKVYRASRSSRQFRKVDIDGEFPIRSMPYWNVPYQGVWLRRHDERALDLKTNEIIRELTKHNRKVTKIAKVFAVEE